MAATSSERPTKSLNDTNLPTRLEGLTLVALRQRGGQIHDFRLSVQDRGIILNGRARSFYAKQLAQHAVASVTTLPIVANEIIVERELHYDIGRSRWFSKFVMVDIDHNEVDPERSVGDLCLSFK